MSKKIDKCIDLGNLPTYYKGIDWKNCNGYKVKFKYGNIKGNLEIGKYINEDLIEVKYNDEVFIKNKDCIKRCAIGDMLGVHNRKYRYNVGDVVNVNSGTVTILEQTRIKYKNNQSYKAYTVKCNVDNHIYPTIESNLYNGHGCPLCTNQVVVKGINDMGTTNPKSLKYVVNIEDAYTHTFKSTKRIMFKCPHCGYEKKMKICDFTIDGFSCNKCGDGISYPNKFAFNLLEQLGLDFTPEYSPEWINPKKYDFFFTYKSKDYILEMDGGWHGKNNTLSGKTKEKSIADDKYKDYMAKENGIHVIRIACDRSRIDEIINNILNSGLSKLFNLNDINWSECEKYACSSLVKIACDYWNNGIHSTAEIGKLMKINYCTVCRYLKIGVILEICNYNINKVRKTQQENVRKIVKQTRSKPIICIDTNQVFSSMNYCSTISENVLKTKLNNRTIYNVLTGIQSKTKGFTFQYITRSEFNTIKSQSPELAFGDFFISTEEPNSNTNK